MRLGERNNRNLIIIGLCAIVAIMAVGYAAFSSQLTINATSEVTSSWCVGFDSTRANDYVPTAGITGGTVPTGSIGFDGNVCDTSYKTVANLSASFKQPGDKIVYTLTIADRGTLNAAIKSIIVDGDSVTTNTIKTKGNVTFRINMPASTALAAGGTTTMTVEAKFQNETDITGVYESGEEQSIEVLINAEQDDGSGGIATTYTGTVYRHNTNRVHNGDNINDNGTVWVIGNPSTGGQYADEYNTEAECQTGYEGKNSPSGYSCQERQTGLGIYTEEASTLNKTYYLKHDIVEDVVTNSYVCFIYNNTEHCMKGADSGASFTQNTQILKDFQTFNNLGAYNYNGGNPTGCAFAASNSRCYGGGFYYVNASSSGNVGLRGSASTYCSVDQAGISTCVV